jgi:hypothetical protein
VTALLDPAARGPDEPRQGKPSKRDRRVAARTRATPTSLPPTAVPAATQPRPVEEPDDGGDEELAEVIPLGVFDARKEAQQWW